MVTALNSWLLVAMITSAQFLPGFRDGYCRLATRRGICRPGGLLLDRERHVICAQRPLILNGIDDFVNRTTCRGPMHVFLTLTPDRGVEPPGRGGILAVVRG